MKKIIKYGLLSTAQIGINAHLPASIESHNSEIISISSRVEEKAKLAAEKNKIKKYFGSYQEQIEDPEVDAIINSLPNSMHCEWTIKCAEAGKHILCEKPLAVTVEECKKMIDAANKNNVLLVEAFTHRWNHHLITAKKIIKNGELGSVVTTDSSLCFTTDPKNNIRFDPSLSGGALWDAGCYAVYATRFVLSEEPYLVSGSSFDFGNFGVDTTFKGVLEFKSGAISTITTSMNQPFRCHMNIDLTGGRIEIPNMFDDSGPIIIRKGTNDDSEEKVLKVESKYRFVSQINEFSDCIIKNINPTYPPEDGLMNTATINALYKSATENKKIVVKSS